MSMIIREPNLEKAKQLIRKAEPPIVVRSLSDEFSRKVLEYGKFQILLLPGGKRDKLKRLDSGLNYVMARIAARNNVAIGVDLKTISLLPKKQKAIELARLKQNIKLCRKAKCKILLLNSKDDKDANSLLQSLGASSQQTK
jgi:RNase P/RNase MRP subunit p30